MYDGSNMTYNESLQQFKEEQRKYKENEQKIANEIAERQYELDKENWEKIIDLRQNAPKDLIPSLDDYILYAKAKRILFHPVGKIDKEYRDELRTILQNYNTKYGDLFTDWQREQEQKELEKLEARKLEEIRKKTKTNRLFWGGGSKKRKTKSRNKKRKSKTRKYK